MGKIMKSHITQHKFSFSLQTVCIIDEEAPTRFRKCLFVVPPGLEPGTP